MIFREEDIRPSCSDYYETCRINEHGNISCGVIRREELDRSDRQGQEKPLESSEIQFWNIGARFF